MERVTYLSTTTDDPAGDAAFESALAGIRSDPGAPAPHLVNGSARADGPVFERPDPSRSKNVIARAHEGDAATVGAAVEAARAAQGGWARRDPAERASLIRSAQAGLAAAIPEFAACVAAETGKPRIEALAEAEEAVDLIEIYCSQAERSDGFRHSLGSLAAGETNTDVLRPYGVFGVIAPFNFPVALVVNMAVAALVTGNTVVLKPSHKAARSAARTGELLAQALPDGVLNIVHGGPRTGGLLAGAHVDGLAFTGSAEVGWQLMRNLQGRPVLAEMGGKNPAIVTASADLDAAAEGIVRSAYGMSGQKCSSCSRVIVDAAVHDDLVERIATRVRALVVGDPADAASGLGPVIDDEAVLRYESAIVEAAREGAVVAPEGGVAARGPRPDESGYFVAPTVVTGLPRGHRLTREELFLPFLTVTPVTSFDEALDEANAVRYGLTAGIFSADESEVDRFLTSIEAGVVYVNRRAGATTGAWPGIQSFCGWKASGTSGKGGLGPYYLHGFMREQCHTVVR